MRPVQRLTLCCVLACVPLDTAYAQTTPALTGPAGASAPNDAKCAAYDSAVEQTDTNHRAARDECDTIKDSNHDAYRV